MNKDKIIAEFKRIKALGYIVSSRSHNTGIGKTFEDLLGVTENNQKDPDFEGFEVKSQREATTSYLTMFTKSPSFPVGANAVLKDKFGTPDSTFPEVKVLHTSCFGNSINSHASGYGFGLQVDRTTRRVYLRVHDLKKDILVPQDVYWTFEELQQCLNSKLRAIFVVTADSKTENGREAFHYTAATIYYNLKFDLFLDALEHGDIMFDIRIGAYKTHGSPQFGKPHDHGSGFRIKRAKLGKICEETLQVG